MNRKPNLSERFTQFITGKGFYLVVLLCVAAIGISGYFLLRSITGAVQSETVTAVGTTQLPEESQSVTPSQTPSASPSVSPSSVSSSSDSDSASVSVSEAPSASVTPSEEPETSASAASAPLVFTRPVNGAVIASFSVETLLYDETMLDWRVHEGLDLAASEGTRVLATAAGTVSAVYEDELMGTTIVIDHGEGLESVYSNLGAMPNVAAGDSVYTGDIIAAVGSTAAAESGRDAHLHFALYLDGQAVDPEEYLPE
jgi:murein DD-endopeptidase MepM/ murein hydrolase activator NlpD